MTVEFFTGIQSFPNPGQRQAVVTVGTFDGIHRGHQEIFRRVQVDSEQSGLLPVLVTFDPHPRTVVTPENVPMLLTTATEKARFIPDFFHGKVLTLPFDTNLMNMSGEQFVEQILIERIGMAKLIVGYDHAVGRDRGGNIDELERLGRKHNYEMEVVQPVAYKDQAVSSSRIRTTLTSGNFEEALRMFGHDYAICGKVERGIGLGRKLGYPTANVRVGSRKLLPPEGVYACWVQVGTEEKNGMMFIGRNQFNPEDRISVEANIFDFDRDIYDEEMLVCPTHFIRANQKFENTDRLVDQIAKDKENVIHIIERENSYVLHKGPES